MNSGESINQASVDRPGCITAYAILLWIGSAFLTLAMIAIGPGFLLGTSGEMPTGYLLLACLFLPLTVLSIATGIGIWKMRRWGLWLVIINNSGALFAGILSLCSVLSLGSNVTGAVRGFFGLVINGFVLYWFIKNRALFSGWPVTKSVFGEETEGRYGDAPEIIALFGAGLVFACLIVVAVIGTLFLFGDSIGNVFSQIATELE